MQTLKGHNHHVRSVVWIDKGDRLASGSSDKTIKIWGKRSQPLWKCLSTLEGHNHDVQSVAWSQNGGLLASGSLDRTIKIWDPTTAQCISTFDGSDMIESVSWTDDGRRLASASRDKAVKIWDPETGQCVLTLKGHSEEVTSVAWSHDGSQLV